jgi:DNA-binding Lrp family transcriptional regulator
VADAGQGVQPSQSRLSSVYIVPSERATALLILSYRRRILAPMPSAPRVDPLDARLLQLLAAEPRIGVLEASRRLGVARGTVQARLDKLIARGVIASLGPALDPGALGFGVTAFTTLEIRQGSGDEVLEHLGRIPEVLEVHKITGAGDLLCRIVARDNADLQRVIDDVVRDRDIERTSTVIALATPVSYRVLPLLGAVTP